MAGGNRNPLTKRRVAALLDQLTSSVTRQECWSCECLQGFLAQMELDATPAAKLLAARRKVTCKEIHACRGCEPCPPAQIFAAYLLRKHQA